MLQDKVAIARKMDSFLKNIIASGAFKLKYRITVNPPVALGKELETPEILVELAGPDSQLLLERGAEALRALELLTHEALHLHPEDHDKVSFDCKGYRAARQQEWHRRARGAGGARPKRGVALLLRPRAGAPARVDPPALPRPGRSDPAEGGGGRPPLRGALPQGLQAGASCPPLNLRCGDAAS